MKLGRVCSARVRNQGNEQAKVLGIGFQAAPLASSCVPCELETLLYTLRIHIMRRKEVGACKEHGGVGWMLRLGPSSLIDLG